MYGKMVALKAGLVQGSYSFIITLFMTLMLEGLHRVLSRYIYNRAIVNVITIVSCCSLVFSGSWIVNMMAGTPEVFRTVILGYIIGGLFSITYVLGLSQKR